MVKLFYRVMLFTAISSLSFNLNAQDNIIDQIVWVVGDEAILKSDVEGVRLQMQLDGERFEGDPYCLIPEQIAVQKLFLHQAKADSIDVPTSTVSREVERRLNSAISQFGSRDKLEEYLGKTVPQLKDEWKEQLRDNEIVREVQKKIVGKIRLTPSDVRKYYSQLPQDSLPFVPTTVETQIITMKPSIPLSEIDAVKARLRDYTDRINKGETDFSTLALMYSEDTESAKKGGELGFTGRSNLVPEFASAAFALSDPKKVSNVVESEYGFHIIQLIERRGDLINVRHILLKPRIPAEEIKITTNKMDSLLTDIKAKKFSFDEAAQFVSYDKETRNNNGLMVNKSRYSANEGTPRFEMRELPQEIGKIVDKMQVGDISNPFTMLDNNGKEIVAIVKLKQRTEGHKANISDDYQTLKAIVEIHKRDEIIKNWLQKKINNTYIRINDDWKNCDFQYSGWIK